MLRRSVISVVLLVGSAVTQDVLAEPSPMRPLPTASARPLSDAPAFFVDAKKGNDGNDGSQKQPWKTIQHAIPRLQPGQTLYLRGGTFYEHVDGVVSGEERKPITLRSFPGELAIIDGGLREFHDSPATAWIPADQGADDEFVSSIQYPQFALRPVVAAFPAAGWEPFHGKESERPVVLGNFADSMIPLHGYRTITDLRDTSMLWDVDSKFENAEGVYCGPGLWFNRSTLRIHIRLAHTTLAGLGEHGYDGETDPRKLRLCISGPYGADVLRLNGIQHVVIQDIALRGSSGSALINLAGSDHVTFDGVTAFGGAPALLARASSDVRITNCAFRGLSAPWSSRASMKYRGTPEYRIITQRNKPESQDWDISHCEFTDGHDGIWLRYVRNLKFHHNLVDNFNDDGVEFGARKRDQLIYVYQNRISRCLLPFTLHEMEQDESPSEVDPGSGVFITRNIVDLRRGTFKGPPKEPDPSGAYLNQTGALCSDHGGPTWPNYFFYHNTILRSDSAWRGYYGFGAGGQGTRKTTRRVFNNIFVQAQGIPGLIFASGMDDNFVDGNLHWGLIDGPAYKEDFFSKQSRWKSFPDSTKPAGWMEHDIFADPRLNRLIAEADSDFDPGLQTESPAIDSGVAIADDWFDPLKDRDKGRPDIGALPLGEHPEPVGLPTTR
ncbi:MAG: right-handed parallel beta-helix repeat-containing protein [Planctomycetota bacterium]|nr:right-handed parallel beta-helix repeat-containing protein [Planctomycetota bacterium]